MSSSIEELEECGDISNINQDGQFEDEIPEPKMSAELSSYINVKMQEYLDDNDVLALKALAVLSGYGDMDLDTELRQRVWFRLVGMNMDEVANAECFHLTDDQLKSHKDFKQIALDVNRTNSRFPKNMGFKNCKAFKEQLTRLIVKLLIQNQSLHYYQGFHEVCLTFLMVMGEERAFILLNRLVKSHFACFMEPTMEKTNDMLMLIYDILEQENYDVYMYLKESEVGVMFALSWTITWFSHVLSRCSEIVRLYDLFISSHHLMPVYLSLALLLENQDDILDVNCDMASMHQYLTSILKNSGRSPFNWNKLIKSALHLSIKYPPVNMFESRMVKKKRDHLANDARKRGLVMSLQNKINEILPTLNSVTLHIGTFLGLIYALNYINRISN